ncbi:MAG: UbiA-like polyprenyltransferase [Limnochordia bacterium]|nr:UbiA family prenyltransferase [Bacillota bacterium]
MRLGVLLTMIRMEHTLFSLPFAYTGAFLAAGGFPGWDKLLWITVAMVGAHGGAMAWNRLADAGYDAVNPRTREWALPQGQIEPAEVIVFALGNFLLLVYAAYRLEPICFYLAPAAVFFLVSYSYTKRFTSLCHFFLGGTLGLGPVGAWLAVTGRVELAPAILWAAVTLWVGGFDIFYQAADVEVDRRLGLHSIPVRLGVGRSLLVGVGCHVATLFLLVLLGRFAGLGPLYLLGLAFLLLLFVWEVALLKGHRPERLGAAFNVNLAAGVLVFAFTLLDVLTI